MVRRVMGASCVHGCVGVFYAPQVGEETKFCRLNCSNPYRRSADTPARMRAFQPSSPLR
jgi:hypothetical protein